MARIIKVRCNGPDHHVNEVDLDKGTIVVMFPMMAGVDLRAEKNTQSKKLAIPKELPERLVFPCQHCKDGKVIITRDMIQKAKNP
jgi:hypothetical protein